MTVGTFLCHLEKEATGIEVFYVTLVMSKERKGNVIVFLVATSSIWYGKGFLGSPSWRNSWGA